MPGHVFVVHGRVEALVKDAVVVTTDADFTFEPHWEPVLGEVEPGTLRPKEWGEGRLFGQAPGRDDLWFLDVWHAEGSLERLLDGLAGVLAAIAASDLKTSAGRALPLVAIPVPGIGGGGFHEQAGTVIAGLLGTLTEAVERHDFDIVVVTTTAAQFAAVQRERRLRGRFPLPEPLLQQAQDIGVAAAEGRLALFLGAGVSVPAGLPTWSELVEEMRQAALADGVDLPAQEFAALDVLDQTELLQAVLGDRLQGMVAARFRAATPALSHALLASLGCVEAVTTNYDSCYERAVAVQDPEAAVAVMPWELPEPGRPWLLKMHGDAARPESVVLTRGQFIGYDNRWRPVGSVFQSLLMTRQLLIVGASLSDDNVLRLAHEVLMLRHQHDIEESLGHVLGLGPPPLRAQLWQGALEWVPLEGSGREEQARLLELFLDAVVLHACDSSPYLLHPHYSGLLSDAGEAELAQLARELAARITKAAADQELRQDAGWRELAATLRGMGAPG